MHRYVTGASALVILASVAGSPTITMAHEGSSPCNVLLDGDGEPVRERDSDDIAHSNSHDCPDSGEGAVQNIAVEPEPVAVAPAPPPAVDPMVVYFDVNQDSLDAGAQAEVSAYVRELMATSPQSLSVVGYTDTSGPADLNRRLSEARANSVSAALIEAGLPAGMITRGASGEDSLAVSTPDGTREASNRRVTITPSY